MMGQNPPPIPTPIMGKIKSSWGQPPPSFGSKPPLFGGPPPSFKGQPQTLCSNLILFWDYLLRHFEAHLLHQGVNLDF